MTTKDYSLKLERRSIPRKIFSNYLKRLTITKGFMMQLIINNVEVNLVSKDGFAFANSMDVARVFEKRHDNVIQAINNFSDRVLTNFKAKGSIKKTKQKKMLDAYEEWKND